MDDSVRRAMAKWPGVPAVHGWLRLDVHGRWLLRGEPVQHAGLAAFIGRNYMADETGRWYFQNGPQQVYVELDYTPWVLHLDSAGTLRTHTGVPVESIDLAVLDDEGNLLLVTERGPGLIDADTLAPACDCFTDVDGEPLNADTLEAAFAAARASETTDCVFRHGNSEAPLTFVPRAEVASRFGFVDKPAPPDDSSRGAQS